MAKSNSKKYETVVYKKGIVTDATKLENGFQVTTNDGNIYHTDNILFATGYKENVGLNNLPGIEKVYGKSVYPCPFCDGWEHRGQKLALFDNTELAPVFAKTIANWSDDLIIFTNGQQTISDEEKRLLAKGGVQVIQEAIAKLIANEEGILRAVLLENGSQIEREAGFIMDTHQTPATDLPEKLGVKKEMNDWGMEALTATETGKTNVAGVYVVGDARTGFSGIIGAANDGAVCLEMLVHERVHNKWEALKM